MQQAERIAAPALQVARDGQVGGLSRDDVLKRFPQGYGEGSGLLKFRSFTVSAATDLAEAGELSAFVVQKCADMQPLHAWLREALAYRKP